TFAQERNKTEVVNNSRQSFGAQWTQALSDRLSATFGYDYRHLTDGTAAGGEKVTDSHLVTAGLEWRPSDRLSISARREQNLAASDPTYPNQTVLSASYKLNDFSNLFVTQRLASAPVT